MGKILALFNQKGGVGKTTTCLNLCACVAAEGKKVLAVDFDPQSNLTSGLNIQRKSLKKTVYNVLIDRISPREAIIPTAVDNLDILPASIDLAGAEIEMSNTFQRETILGRALREIKNDYDVVMIDCPPSLGLLPINALTASGGVIIPIQCEFYALEGVSQLMNTVNLVKRSLNPDLAIIGVVLTMYDSRTNLSQQVVDEVSNYFGDNVFPAIIPRNVRLAEAPSYGMSILDYDASSKGAKAYTTVARELIKRIETEVK
jgi:chromosome partitioning protein